MEQARLSVTSLLTQRPLEFRTTDWSSRPCGAVAPLGSRPRHFGQGPEQTFYSGGLRPFGAATLSFSSLQVGVQARWVRPFLGAAVLSAPGAKK